MYRDKQKKEKHFYPNKGHFYVSKGSGIRGTFLSNKDHFYVVKGSGLFLQYGCNFNTINQITQ